MRLIFALVLALLMTPAFGADSWTGSWDTRWHNGGARVDLRQEGNQIDGKYPSWGGTVEGTITGRVFSGHWHQGTK